MEMKKVTSSNIAEYGYDAARQVLCIRFTGGAGKTYHYTGVPPEVAQEFESAESKGRAFASIIRGQFPHSIVLDEDKPA